MNIGIDFGKLIACAEFGAMPVSYSVAEGLAEKMASVDGAVLGRSIIKIAHAAMQESGLGSTAPAWHLHFLLKQASWNSHCREMVDDVVQVFNVFKPMQKVAFSDAASGVGTLGRVGLYGSLGAGSGLGALLWLLNRHASQDDTDIESMQHQKQYYDQLGRELHSSLKRKYRYEDQENKQ